MEIASKLGDKDAVRQDLNDAIMAVSAMFHERYIDKLQKDIHNKQEETRKNPNKEIKLIQSIKPFCPSQHHPTLDKVIDTMQMVQTLSTINNDMAVLHKDGVYEIDKNCMSQNKLPMIAVLAAFVFLSRRY